MNNKNNLEFKIDTLGLLALAITFISMLVSFKLAPSEIMLATSIFLVALSTYVYISLKRIVNEHAKEIKRLNEKINIYRDISDLKAKVDFIVGNFKMKKRGQGELIELLIRAIQIGAIILAGYIILKALGAIK